MNAYIASVLEDEVSPLQIILNYEVILALLILVHMIIIILILLHKFYVTSVLNFISKLLSPKTAEKYDKFKKNIEKIGSSFLNILVFINVFFILMNIFILIYANVELSNNIDAYINVHLKMKESISMLLLVKSNFIINTNNNKMEKINYFSAWSILPNNRKLNMDGRGELNKMV